MTGSLLAAGFDCASQAEDDALNAKARPGTWYGDAHADGRLLTQDQTDCMIRSELISLASFRELTDVRAICHGGDRVFEFEIGDRHQAYATRQRGGIDSDQLIRLLAHRAWGDRDARWFEDRGVRVGERVNLIDGIAMMSLSQDDRRGTCAMAWPDEQAWHRGWSDSVALGAGRPGQVIECRVTWPHNGDAVYAFKVTDRPRARPDDGYPMSRDFVSWAHATSTPISEIAELAARMAQMPRPRAVPVSPDAYRIMVRMHIDRELDAGSSEAATVRRIARQVVLPREEVARMVAEQADARRARVCRLVIDDPNDETIAKPSAAAAPEHRPGSRAPGSKPTPHQPRWARDRRGRSPRPGR